MGITKILKNRRRVLGMNERNLSYIRKYNTKKAINIADDKILTKKVLTKANIPTPKLICTIKDYTELETFDWSTLPDGFVIKPVQGLEGGGIEIFYNRDKAGNWIRADKSKITVDGLKRHVKEILDGRFSLNQTPDSALFEERVRTHKVFKYFTYKGTPDVRVIVFNNIPVISFLRLPTEASKGKANLALGAIAAGIDMANGTTTSAIQGKGKNIETIPKTKIQISGLKIPYWNRILRYSIEAQMATNLNFMAVDFLIDRDNGPVIVELNARPGLSIQLANFDGLRWRLRKAQGLKVSTVEKGTRLAKDLFGGEIEDEIETLSGKDVIGIYESVTFFDPKKNEITTKAKIDTGADSTSIDKTLAVKLGYKELVDAFEELDLPEGLNREESLKLHEKIKEDLMPKFPGILEDINVVKSSHGISIRPYVKITLKIKDTVYDTYATVYDRSKLTYPVIIGRKSLYRFLVDPSK